MFLWQIGHQVLPSTWAFYTIAKFHWTSAEVGGSLAFVGFVMAIAQGLLTRVLIPWLGGERQAALAGMAAAVLAYLGYAFVTRGWMMYAVGLTTAVFALAYPAMNALASQRIPANAQGELQGAVASLYGLSSIIGPPVMTGIFGYFSAPSARVHFPGAAFVAAAALTVACAALFSKSMSLAVAPADPSHAPTAPAAVSAQTVSIRSQCCRLKPRKQWLAHDVHLRILPALFRIILEQRQDRLDTFLVGLYATTADRCTCGG